MSKKKMGRPTDNPKATQIAVRFDDCKCQYKNVRKVENNYVQNVA